MKRFRDAKTGGYISEEEAQMRDPATWIEEHDRPKSCKKELRAVYEKCKEVVSIPKDALAFNGTAILPLFVLKRILNEFGAEIGDDE